MDRADHGELGHRLGSDGDGRRPGEFHRLTLAPRRRGGGIFSRHHPYLTYWFPEAARARIVGAFMTAVPLSSVIGNPLSAFLLGFDGIGGIAGWRWLFILEGVPAVLLGIAVWFYLPDRPAEARFLSAEARNWLTATLAAEQEANTAQRRFNLIGALTNPKVLLLAAIYFGLVMALYGIVLWLRQASGDFAAGLVVLGLGCLAAAGTALVARFEPGHGR